jgi:cell wall assembly regulator SMI1
MKKTAYRTSATLAMAALHTVSAAAAVPETLDFALHVSRLETKLSVRQQRVDTVIERAGIASFDTSNAALQPGLYAGYAWVNLTNQSSAAGLQPGGYYIGPAIRSAMAFGRNLNLTATAGFLYQRTKDDNAAQAIVMEWYQPQLDLDAAWHIAAQLNVTAGGQYSSIDADEKLSGAVNQTVTLERHSIFGGHAGLELDLGDDGQVGFLIHRDIGNGVELYFQQQF